MYKMVRTLIRMTDAGKFNGFPGFLSVHTNHVPVGDHIVILKSLPDGIWLNELQELILIRLRDIFSAICGDRFHIGEGLSGLKSLEITSCLITDTGALVQFHIVHTLIVGG